MGVSGSATAGSVPTAPNPARAATRTPSCDDVPTTTRSTIRPPHHETAPVRRVEGVAESVDAPAESPVVQFADAARSIGAAARRLGLVAPTFRTPPRLVGLDRTVRRHTNGAAVSVRGRDRPWVAVLADMIEGVLAVNDLDALQSNRVRADLWGAAVALAPSGRRVA
ncbi:hypothetical protein BH24ACT5_BH24ACT5_23710 [soil metagenome]